MQLTPFPCALEPAAVMVGVIPRPSSATANRAGEEQLVYLYCAPKLLV